MACRRRPCSIPGCTDLSALNFNVLATSNNGSCVPAFPGCTDPSASNCLCAATTTHDQQHFWGFVSRSRLSYA
ncbi:hypothetical protein OAO87_04335 [bacterium]|nr:hypothetical protein [bacterium]